MESFMHIVKALSDSNRVRVLYALRDRELCVCQIIEMLGLAPSTVSKHLSILRYAGLIEGRKEGRWMYYRLPEHPRGDVRDALSWVLSAVSRTSEITADANRLKRILKTNPIELCRSQH